MSPDPTWRPDRLLKILLIWTSFTTLIFWLPTVRGAFDGDSYEWGVLGFSGRGISISYWFPLTGSLFSIVLLWLGWRGARFPFNMLLGGWHSFLAVGLTMVVQQDPDGFHLKGDTVGMDIDLALVGPVFFGGWMLLTWWWIVRDFRQNRNNDVPTWTKRNRAWLSVLVALVPVQFILLHSGTIESLRDQLGVLLSVAQWLILGAAFVPREARQA
ncbi:MAG: hypothetical protein ABI599_12700 [Flavobacteriales bacterium]